MDPVLHLCIAAKKMDQRWAMIDLIIDLNESSLDLESSVVAAATYAGETVA